METNEFEIVKNLKRLTALHFRTLKPANDESKNYIAQIEVLNYLELGCVITDMLKLCILALDHDMHNVPEKKNQSINVGLVLETVLQMFPLNEMEFLSCVGEVVGE
ncbi:hypothetical protein SAMN05444671_1382 [Flavobacterium sp. CF108]|uniref:hypothetical protein n=1 Tax=unclassified Flavobacterium TaxID=196869 RepID=UPI0008D8CDEA|nr:MULTISPECIES: hypothetical protein [unclassified Flavobacterium]SEO80123.1 hypothetical protein SAMN04487978_3671 [Flavobacterium sp. fv08]SHG75373.1 hypothetical protein SAMN05444671_1382 [Flavobacterium sp. CF108]